MVLITDCFADCIARSNSLHADIVQFDAVHADVDHADVVQVGHDQVDAVHADVVHADVVLVDVVLVDAVPAHNVGPIVDLVAGVGKVPGVGKIPGVGSGSPGLSRAGCCISWSGMLWCGDSRGPCRTCPCSTGLPHSSDCRHSRPPTAPNLHCRPGARSSRPSGGSRLRT